MVKRPKRMSHTLGWLRSIKDQRKHIVRASAVMAVTLGLLELSKYMFQAHLTCPRRTQPARIGDLTLRR